jgi:hypothetical protein
MGSSVRVHLKLFSHGRPTWGLDVQDLRASATRNTWLKEGGLVERDQIGLPPLANLASVPTWLKAVERQLKVDLEIAGATFEVGRAKSIEPLLRSWLAPGAAAPAKTPIERIDAFARLATRYSHLPGMLKQRQKLVFPEVATAAIAVARRWSAISRKDPCDLDLPDYAVLIALASDRRAPVDAARASIVRGQQLAAKLQGDPDWACDDVVSRIRAAVRK